MRRHFLSWVWDSRKQERVDFAKYELKSKISVGLGDHETEGLILDLSTDGILLWAREEPRVSDVLHVIAKPSWSPQEIDFVGRIKWIRRDAKTQGYLLGARILAGSGQVSWLVDTRPRKPSEFAS